MVPDECTVEQVVAVAKKAAQGMSRLRARATRPAEEDHAGDAGPEADSEAEADSDEEEDEPEPELLLSEEEAAAQEEMDDSLDRALVLTHHMICKAQGTCPGYLGLGCCVTRALQQVEAEIWRNAPLPKPPSDKGARSPGGGNWRNADRRDELRAIGCHKKSGFQPPSRGWGPWLVQILQSDAEVREMERRQNRKLRRAHKAALEESADAALKAEDATAAAHDPRRSSLSVGAADRGENAAMAVSDTQSGCAYRLCPGLARRAERTHLKQARKAQSQHDILRQLTRDLERHHAIGGSDQAAAAWLPRLRKQGRHLKQIELSSNANARKRATRGHELMAGFIRANFGAFVLPHYVGKGAQGKLLRPSHLELRRASTAVTTYSAGSGLPPPCVTCRHGEAGSLTCRGCYHGVAGVGRGDRVVCPREGCRHVQPRDAAAAATIADGFIFGGVGMEERARALQEMEKENDDGLQPIGEPDVRTT